VGFTIKDKHFTKWFPVSENCEAECLIKMFPESGWNSDWLKTLITEDDSVDPRLCSDRLYTAAQLQTVVKVENQR